MVEGVQVGGSTPLTSCAHLFIIINFSLAIILSLSLLNVSKKMFS